MRSISWRWSTLPCALAMNSVFRSMDSHRKCSRTPSVISSHARIFYNITLWLTKLTAWSYPCDFFDRALRKQAYHRLPGNALACAWFH